MSSLLLCGSLGRWLLLVGGGEERVRVCEWVQLSAVTQWGGGGGEEGGVIEQS